MTTKQLKQTVADNIKRLREEKGLESKELAELVGKPKTRVSEIEKGEENPTLSTLNDYAKALGCEVWELVKSKTDTSDAEIEKALLSAYEGIETIFEQRVNEFVDSYENEESDKEDALNILRLIYDLN